MMTVGRLLGRSSRTHRCPIGLCSATMRPQRRMGSQGCPTPSSSTRMVALQLPTSAWSIETVLRGTSKSSCRKTSFLTRSHSLQRAVHRISLCSPAARPSIPLTAMPKRKKPESNPDVLKGWQQIAAFLGQPVSVAQRWANDGMPVRKQGRYVETTREELNRWLGRESAGGPVQIATDETDLSAELKRGLSFICDQNRVQSRKRKDGVSELRLRTSTRIQRRAEGERESWE
jgi:hypothetical protein